jgi:formylglycine-generating enzyme required for sulfatase activity
MVPPELASQIRERRPTNIKEFHLCRIAEWSAPRYHLDKRFVNLTLLLDEGEAAQQRWQRAENIRFNDLRDVLKKTENDPVLALLGAPGSGKSTLLRRLQLDHSADRLRDGSDWITFFIQLNEYHGEQKPREWLISSWSERYPQLSSSVSLEDALQGGRVLLLLDALNEMQPRSGTTYLELVNRWKEFAQRVAREGNRILFSCRSLDYSATLSSKDLPVPQIEIQPMSAEQVNEFINFHIPKYQMRIWNSLHRSPQFDLYRTPYFLKLLCEQVDADGDLPKGRAGLFTGFVRKVLLREIDGELFRPSPLLTHRDHKKLSRNEWRDAFDLPEKGLLIPKLSELAHAMQENGVKRESIQVRVERDEVSLLIGSEYVDGILRAGLSLNILDEFVADDEIVFFHQLLQEYFAARRLAREPKPDLTHAEWSVDRADPPLQETLSRLADGDPLPPLPQTGWEETTLSAAPMAKDPEGFIQTLIPHNLPLAARCAASAEVKISEQLKAKIRQELIGRTHNMQVDLRARIAAGEALGIIGDPRYEREAGLYGDYLSPPLIEILGGVYPMGDDEGKYDEEKPAHQVELNHFQIGQFPVTNAEYKYFIDANGYNNEHWWDTEESKAWLSGKLSTEGIKKQWRENRKTYQGWGAARLRNLVKQNRWTTKQAENWINWCGWTDEHFERALNKRYPAGKQYQQPEHWDDSRFNNPSQPVVGVTWFEARAYCNWLTSTARVENHVFRLPTEAEFEAAARGANGRRFPHPGDFESSRCNTFESHIRRTTPIGIFENATSEGAFDLMGNAYTWTLSIYDQQKFPYPYRADDGRDDLHQAGVHRILRGGSWFGNQLGARAVYRGFFLPARRDDDFGFRIVCSPSPSRK